MNNEGVKLVLTLYSYIFDAQCSWWSGVAENQTQISFYGYSHYLQELGRSIQK